MLSEKIRNLRSTLRAALDEGRLTRSTVKIALERLGALADQAEVLEGLTIPLGEQLNDANIPDNVVRIASKLDRLGVRVGVGDGGAA